MSDCQWIKRLSEYVVGGLKGRDQEYLKRHLGECTACRQELAALEQTGVLLNSVTLEQAPEGTWGAVRERIVRRTAPARARLRWALGAAMGAVALVLLVFGVLLLRPAETMRPLTVTTAEADQEMRATMEGHVSTTWAAPLADEAAMGLRLGSMEDDG